MSIVDANIVLRYLLDDHDELSEKAAAILENQTVSLPIEAACEVVYVLQKVYSVNRQEIRRLLTGLLSESLVSMEKPEIFIKALEFYGNCSLDFVDTLLCAYHVVDGRQVFSFDNKLNQFIERGN
jgi:predicted nucleic-acid-binding protein